MSHTTLTLSEANALLHPLMNLPISKPWQGVGSAIFFELGELTPIQGRRQTYETGEATIFVGWDWRVEQGCHVLFGSTNSCPTIAEGIKKLLGTKIEHIVIQGEVPEVHIRLSNGLRVISAPTSNNGDEWHMSLPDQSNLSCDKGVIYLGESSTYDITADEEASMDCAKETAKRWGIPFEEAKLGNCIDCKWMVRIDGDFSLLDYGVCTSIHSAFDGRVVNRKSGCRHFLNEQGNN